jgi:hypothetical protein
MLLLELNIIREWKCSDTFKTISRTGCMRKGNEQISIKGKQAIESFLVSVILSTGFIAVIFKQIYSCLKTNAKAIN